MKIFPESIVPDPDKKINIFDKSLINKINDNLLKSNQNMRLLKQDYRTGLIIKKDKKLAKKYIFKKILSEIK